MGGTIEELNHGWTRMDTDRESNIQYSTFDIQHSSDQSGETDPSDQSDPTFSDQRPTPNDQQPCLSFWAAEALSTGH